MNICKQTTPKLLIKLLTINNNQLFILLIRMGVYLPLIIPVAYPYLLGIFGVKFYLETSKIILLLNLVINIIIVLYYSFLLGYSRK